MGLMLIASVLPGLVIGPFAGALIDKWPRKPLIILPDVVRGIVVMAVTILSAVGLLEIWHLVTAAIMLSLGSAFFDPTVQAIIPQIVTEDQLPKANALNQMVGGISTVIGPILGGVAVGFLGFTNVFLINGLSYLISAFFEGFMIISPVAEAQMKQNNIIDDLKEGYRFLASSKKIMIIIGVIGISHFFIGSLMVILPFLANNLTGEGVRNLGSLQTMLGIGLILGTVFINIKKKTILRDFGLFIFIALVGTCYIGIGLVYNFNLLLIYPYTICMGVIGIAIANASVYWQSSLQLNTPNYIAGRIFSLSTMIGNISMPVAYGLYGLLLNQFSIASLMLFSGFSLVGISFFLMYNYYRKTADILRP